MYSRDIVFGDGMTQIFAPEPVIEVFDINRPKRKRQPKPAMSTREMLILISCAAPVMLGLTFLTVMIQHTALYISYWIAVWSWVGLVIYANTQKARSPRGKGKRAIEVEPKRSIARMRGCRKCV